MANTTSSSSSSSASLNTNSTGLAELFPVRFDSHSSPRRHFPVVGIPEASATSKRKVKHPASAEQTEPLELSTNIDTADIQVLTPTRIQPAQSSKRKRTQPRRQVIILAESDKESSESHAF
ncbi:hypothetical protein V6N13_110625 [Hibiscus sabdariffa]